MINPLAEPVAEPPVPADTPVPLPEVSTEDKFGVEPEDYSQEFLRQETVLLKPGQWQMDVGLNYTIVDHVFADFPSNEFRVRRRLLVMPLELRYGLTDRIQLFAAMPVGWTNTEYATNQAPFGTVSFSNQGGIGDTSAGFSYMLHKSDGWYCSPDVVATFGFTAPSSNSDILAALYGTQQTTLGQGVWAGFWNLLFMHTYDPITVFYGFGSRHAFTRSIHGYSVKPGDQYMYRGGVGFAVNERVTLSTTLFGYYITEAQVDNVRYLNTIQELVYMRFAATMIRRCNRICEPFAEIGLTDDAANARFGITWTF